MDIVKHAWWESSRGPQLTYVENASAHHGASAPARQGSPGPTHELTREDVSWLRAEIVAAVLACARDAYRNGHRDLARSLLEPYYAMLRDGIPRPELPLEVESRAVTVNALAANLRTNLDYFGDPPGWVPRLRLSANFEAFSTMRQASLKLLYYGMTMEQKYDDLQHKKDIAEQTSKALESELAETGWRVPKGRNEPSVIHFTDGTGSSLSADESARVPDMLLDCRAQSKKGFI